MTNWQERALCLGEDPYVFFEGPPRDAISICQMCPVREECLAAGMEEPSGIWGGVTPRDREKIRGARYGRGERLSYTKRTDDVVQTIIDAYSSGLGHRRTAEATGYSRSMVRRVITEAGIARGPDDKIYASYGDKRAHAEKLLQEGLWTVTDIARIVECTVSYVSTIKRRLREAENAHVGT